MRVLLILLLALHSFSYGELHPGALASMDATIRLGIHEKHFPGGVLWFQHEDEVYHRAYGNRTTDPDISANSKDTIYDAASLTKVLATTPSVMLLVEQGKVDLEKTVATYLPEFTGDGKERILVRQLMTHTSGLRPGIPRKPEWKGYTEGFERIWADQPINEPDTKFVYSDINFILLGELVRRVSGLPLDQFCQKHIFGPLKMKDTGFLPSAEKRDRIAPSTREGDTVVHGIVHDPTSRSMGGVTGHAGLFIT
ncbi:MAG: serine hydrolase domain-containing protein, partial [Verrucomicrobiales bacterium]